MMEAVEILSQIPASFYTQIESKKWSDRKEALEIVEKATSASQIQNNDYNELIRVLKKTVAKDSNIVVVTSAAKCICQLARGLGTNFNCYSSCLPILFEKFKEKKPNVISVIRDATDAVFVGTNLESIHEDVIQFLDNKNPQIKSEMALFLARTFSNFSPQVMNKKILRPLINALIKTLSDMDATVRDSSAMAIGTAMKITGEKLMMSLIADVEPIKIAKIKEFCEKAEIVTAPTIQNGHSLGLPMDKDLTNGQTNQQQDNRAADDDEDEEDRTFEMMEAVEILSQIPASFYTQMESKKWSDRKEALEIVEKVTSVPKIQNNDYNELIRVLKKTVAKDSNIVVVTLAAKCICQLAKGLRSDFANYTSCLPVLFEKFKEKKPNVNSVIRDATDAVFVATNLENILEDVTQFLDNKNPQIKSEMALFLARTFSKFPAQVLNKKSLRPLINALIKTLSDMDATVRDNSAMAIGTAMKITGEKLMMTIIADVEPIKLPKIKEFCEKAEVKKIPQSVLSTISAGNAPPVANNPLPPPSSATMVRPKPAYLKGKAPLPKVSSAVSVKSAPAPVPPASNATIKRTATIIKRSTVPKRASGVHHPAPPSIPQIQPTAATIPSMGPPSAPALAQPTPAYNTPQQQFQPQQFQPQPHHFQPQHPVVSTPAKPVFSAAQLNPPVVSTTTKFIETDNFDMVVYKLISDDDDEVMCSITEIENSLTNSPESTLYSRVNQIIDLACIQLIKRFDTQKLSNGNNNDTNCNHKISRLINCLIKLFDNKQLVATANQQSIRFLLVQIFTLTQTYESNHISQSENNDDEFTLKSLNTLASAVIDGFEPSNMMCILTGLLNEPPPSSIVESIKAAIIRSMRSFK